MRFSFALSLARASLLAGLATLALPASAQTPEVLGKLYACKAITDPAARLACYDEGVGRVEAAQNAGELVAIDREAVEDIKRDSFGFNIPSLPKIGFLSRDKDGNTRSTQELEPEAQIFLIASTAARPRGGYVFTLENGQVWEQIDAAGLNRAPKKGQSLHIRPAAMGSFLAQVDGSGRGIRVKRRE